METYRIGQNDDELALVDLIFNFAFDMALRDATLQKAYRGTDKKILRENDEARRFVKEYIHDIFIECHPCFYDIEKKVEESYNRFIGDNKLVDSEGKPAEFSFGNSQKLINMTAKYMYITAYTDDAVRAKFQCCHCPMDSIMVEKVKKKIEEAESSDEEFRERIKQLAERFTNSPRWKTFLSQPWSGINSSDYCQYDLFQSMVSLLAQREQLSPIEFDYRYWNYISD